MGGLRNNKATSVPHLHERGLGGEESKFVCHSVPLRVQCPVLLPVAILPTIPKLSWAQPAGKLEQTHFCPDRFL